MLTFDNSIKKKSLPPLVKVNEVARLLSLCNASVHKLIQSGDLTAAALTSSKRKERKHVRVTRASLLTFYRKRFGHSLLDALAHSYQS